MKKLIAILLLIFVCSVTFVACSPTEQGDDGAKTFTMIAPDGAPALAISELMAKNMQFDQNINYSIVSANDIQLYVTGNLNKHADFALLPVNLASSVLSQGTEYKMVGVVTQGNLYLLSKSSIQVTKQNVVESFIGKTIGVVNLGNVPGLTTKATLASFNLEFFQDDVTPADNVRLVNIDTTVDGAIPKALNSGSVDFVVAPEPAVSNITANAPVIKKVGALHDLYGRYPQAVLVVKSDVISANAKLVKDIFETICGATDYVTANVTDAVSAVKNHLAQGAVTTMNTTNINANSIQGSSILPQTMTSQTIAMVNDYIEDIIAISPQNTKLKQFPATFFVNLGNI